jgi:hypothetical protein
MCVGGGVVTSVDGGGEFVVGEVVTSGAKGFVTVAIDEVGVTFEFVLKFAYWPEGVNVAVFNVSEAVVLVLAVTE